MTKILIINNGSAYNRGCQALTDSIIAMIRTVKKDSVITIMTQYPEYDKAVFAEYKQLKFVPYPVFSKKYSFAFNLKKYLPKTVFQKNEYVKELINADLVISSGGDTLSSDYGTQGLLYHLRLIELAVFMKKNVYVLGASLGPFSKEVEKKAISILKECTYISVREDKTVDYLKAHGIEANVRLVADPAFLLLPQKVGFVESWFAKQKRVVGIGMSQSIAHFSKTDRNAYVDTFVALCNRLISEKNASIVLIPHVFGPYISSDDRCMCEYLYRIIEEKGNVYLANLNYSAAELKYIISKCTVFIGARTHSTIAALSQCIPTVSIAYSVKAYGINEQLFGHSRYVVDVKEISEAKLFSVVDEVMSEAQTISHILKQRINEIKKAAQMNQDILCELINQDGV